VDKSEYVEKAPIYYALGIAIGIADEPSTIALSMDQVHSNFSPGSSYGYFRHSTLANTAIKLLHDAGAIEVIVDDFGPILVRSKHDLSSWLRGAAYEKFSLFRKYGEHENREWLKDALRSVNEHYEMLGVTASDFDEAEIETQWEPIPLDRKDEKLQAATEALDTAIKDIEADNGYPTHRLAGKSRR